MMKVVAALAQSDKHHETKLDGVNVVLVDQVMLISVRPKSMNMPLV